MDVRTLLLICAVVAVGAAAYTVFHLAAMKLPNGAGLALIVMVPLAAVLLWPTLKSHHALEYNPSCDNDCIGNAPLQVLVYLIVGCAEVGVLGGLMHSRLHRSRTKDRTQQGRNGAG